MLVVVDSYEPRISLQDSVTAPVQRYRYVDLDCLIQNTRRARMTADLFNHYYKSFLCMVGSLRYQDIIPGRDFDHSRYLIRGFHPTFRIQLLAYLRLLEPHHIVDKPWNLKTVVHTAKTLLKLSQENNYAVAPPGDGTFYSGEHSLFHFLARYSSAEEITESPALQFSMDDYIQEEKDLGRFDDVAEDAACKLLSTIQSREDSDIEAVCQPPSAVMRKPVTNHAPSHKRDSLESTSDNAQTRGNSLDDGSTMNPYRDLASLPGHLREGILANTPTQTVANPDPNRHIYAPVATHKQMTASTAVRRSDECSFCSERDGHRVSNCPVARDYIARGLCYRDPVRHQLIFPDGTRLTRQAPGANFRRSVDMWHARRTAELGNVAVATPHRMGNAHKDDDERERNRKPGHGITHRANEIIDTASAAGKVGNSTVSRSATSIPVVSCLGMSAVGMY